MNKVPLGEAEPGKLKVSIIVPVFNEQEIIIENLGRIHRVLTTNAFDFELIVINDGSTDETQNLLESCDLTNLRIVTFSRNFGHQSALLCGLRISSGDVVIPIDADLQDPPELIPQLITEVARGADVVHCVRTARPGESPFKKFSANFYYKALATTSRTPIPRNSGDFKAYSKRAILALVQSAGHEPYIRGLASWIGFRQVHINYARSERAAGETKFTLKKMIALANRGLFGFSDLPLRLSMIFASIFTVAAFLGLIATVFYRLTNSEVAQGWASTVTIMLFGFGSVFAILGIMSQYLSRILGAIQSRPDYIIASEK